MENGGVIKTSLEELDKYFVEINKDLLSSDIYLNETGIEYSQRRKYNELRRDLIIATDITRVDSSNYFSLLETKNLFLEAEEFEKIVPLQKSINTYERIVQNGLEKISKRTQKLLEEKDRLVTNYFLESIKVNPIKCEN